MCWLHTIIPIAIFGSTACWLMLQYKIVVWSIYSVCVQDLYLTVVVVLCHTVLLVNKEGMEDVEMEEGGPSRQH